MPLTLEQYADYLDKRRLPWPAAPAVKRAKARPHLVPLEGVRAVSFVSCAGTGAHLTGIARALRRAGYAVDVTLVEPEGCDSRNGVFVSHRFEALACGAVASLSLTALAERVVLGETSELGSAELGLQLRSRRRGDRTPRGGGFERDATEPVERRNEDRRVREQLRLFTLFEPTAVLHRTRVE